VTACDGPPRDDRQSRRYCTAWFGFATQESAFDQTSAGLPAWFETAGAINPVIAHPMLSRGNEVTNRTNFVAAHVSGLALFGHAVVVAQCPFLGQKQTPSPYVTF
jgi:hypothetical protein